MYRFSILFFCSSILFPFTLSAQIKKPLDHADVRRWRKVEQERISNDGQWVAWVQAPVAEGDPVLHLWSARTGKTAVFPRSTEAFFSEDSKLLVFRIKPALDTLKAQRRRKVKDENLPKDTLGIYSLAAATLEKKPNLKNFIVPEKWSGWLFYQSDCENLTTAKKDTIAKTSPDSVKVAKPVPRKNGKKPKKENKENGYRLIVCNTGMGAADTIAFVENYVPAEKGNYLLLNTTGKGDTLTFHANPQMLQAGVYLLELDKNRARPLLRGKGKYRQLSLNESGTKAAFLADTDTTKARIRPWQLCYWGAAQDSARVIAHAQSNFLTGLDTGAVAWGLSEFSKPVFSDDDSKLYFGITPPPVLNDTTLLPEEIVNVEVWAWTEKRLYTQQKVQLENEKKRSYAVIWRIPENRFVPLGSPDMPELRFQEQRDAELALGFTEEPYAGYLSSEGTAHKDLYAVDLRTGQRNRIVRDLRCNPRLSPDAGYIVWWSDPDSAWFAWNAATGATARMTDNGTVPFYDEENDVPDYPNEYGLAGWLRDDAAMLVYDKYDIWKADPSGKKKPERLTRGRELNITYRYLRLDPEERSIKPDARLLLHVFSQTNKDEKYAWLDLKTGETDTWPFGGGFAYSRRPLKAKNADNLIYTRENFQTFPDLVWTLIPKGRQTEIADPKTVSNANPQQSEYLWGSIELVEWTSLSGEKLSGLLVKPENFDPAKQYPMIVNFYEKLSDGLHQHRTPDFHRSQINWTFYASRGYLVFAPDIRYRTGYPGESAYDAIVSGVTALIAKGFVDPKHIGLQGHSWGGYQSAYLVTRTNLFACAEAGAPVANMTSAYGGIRWESGLSRAFQYEHQQSRIGGSLWEYPMRYLENSPLFALPKVQTPLLILHNDKDGAVPWYQGIELFTGLRRLGKPAWLLNYNDEPHWPLKLQNRIDFQTRMQQFFDHFLQNAPEPRWMQRGVPPGEKGILQGLEIHSNGQ